MNRQRRWIRLFFLSTILYTCETSRVKTSTTKCPDTKRPKYKCPKYKISQPTNVSRYKMSISVKKISLFFLNGFFTDQNSFLYLFSSAAPQRTAYNEVQIPMAAQGLAVHCRLGRLPDSNQGLRKATTKMPINKIVVDLSTCRRLLQGLVVCTSLCLQYIPRFQVCERRWWLICNNLRVNW